MCCSIRAAVFFLASMHIYFSITHMVQDLPHALTSFGDRPAAAVLAIIFSLVFFSSGFMTFRGADEESSVLVGGGAIVLFLILGERFTIMYFGLLLKPQLPEGEIFYVYGTTIPIIFTVLLYLVYFAILFCYHNELQYTERQRAATSPPNYQSPRHIRPPSGAGTPGSGPPPLP